MEKCVIGIDLGGTNARCAIINEQLDIIARERCSTPAKDGFEAVARTLAQLVQDTLALAKLDEKNIAALCIACPGAFDSDKPGYVIEAPNLSWRDVPVAAKMEELTGIRTFLENDANAAAYGEYIAGAGKGANSMVMMTLGTGVGGAIILNGQLLRGPCLTAGEIGHVVVQDGGRKCGCGQRGCLEAYSSATATVARFLEGRRFGWQTSLSDVPPAEVTCAAIFRAAKEGDDLAKHTVSGTAHYIAIAASNIANFLNPNRLVISGGMIQAGDFLFDQIRNEYYRRPLASPVQHMRILPAQLEEDAGVMGAAGVALNRINSGR